MDELNWTPEGAAAELAAMMPPPKGPSEQREFTESEAAAFLGISPTTLASRRRAGKAPACYSKAAWRRAMLAVAERPEEDARWTGGTPARGDLRYSRAALQEWQNR